MAVYNIKKERFEPILSYVLLISSASVLCLLFLSSLNYSLQFAIIIIFLLICIILATKNILKFQAREYPIKLDIGDFLQIIYGNGKNVQIAYNDIHSVDFDYNWTNGDFVSIILKNRKEIIFLVSEDVAKSVVDKISQNRLRK